MKQTIILISILIMLVILTIICYIREKMKGPWKKIKNKKNTRVYKISGKNQSVPKAIKDLIFSKKYSLSRKMNKIYLKQLKAFHNTSLGIPYNECKNKKLHCGTCGDENKDATRMYQLLLKVRNRIQHGKPVHKDYSFIKEINNLIEDIESKITEVIG